MAQTDLSGRSDLLKAVPADETVRMASSGSSRVQHSSHWGAFEVEVAEGRIVGTRPFAKDPRPSPLSQSFPEAVYHPTRIQQPWVRSGWLEGRGRDGGAGRGAEPFVPVSWERALDLVGDEISRVRRDHGNESIFAAPMAGAAPDACTTRQPSCTAS